MIIIQIDIIENNKDHWLLIKKELEKVKKFELKLNFFEDGESFLSKIEESSIPDVLILDLQIPEISGLEILSRLKEQNIHDIFSIVFTSSKSDLDISRASDLGCDVYLVKPYGSFGRLRSVIEDYLNKKISKGEKMKLIDD